jgi:hypothetical protein
MCQKRASLNFSYLKDVVLKNCALFITLETMPLRVFSMFNSYENAKNEFSVFLTNNRTKTKFLKIVFSF